MEGPTPQLSTKRSLVPGVPIFFRWYQALAVHSTAAVGFHFGGRPHKRNYCFVLTSLVLGGLHQRSGVALPTGGRADPAVGNEALAGTRGSVFFCWYQALAEHSTAAVGFHFGGRPHKRNYCFSLTSLVLGGLHQRSGVALPTGGGADPAVGNEALAGTRRSVFFCAGTRRSLVPHTKTKTFFCCSS